MTKSLKISNFIVYQSIKIYMNISDSLDQYADICRDAIKKSSAKLNKRFENLLIKILLLYMIIPRKINFTQMEWYGRLIKSAICSGVRSSRSLSFMMSGRTYLLTPSEQRKITSPWLYLKLTNVWYSYLWAI